MTDRPTRAHEHVFMLTKRPRYWYDADAIREESDPEQQAHNERYAKVYAAQADRAATTGQPGNVNNAGVHSRPGKPLKDEYADGFNAAMRHIYRALHPAASADEEGDTVTQSSRQECQNDNHDPGCGCGARHWMTAATPTAEEDTNA